MQPATTTPQRVLCLWLPNWPIQRLVAVQPELKRQRVVLFRQDSRKGQLIAAASPLAQRDGVKIEMPLAEAKSLLSRGAQKSNSIKQGPLFHVLPHDPAADLFAIEKLADDLDAFSPIIGLQQDTDRPDCIFLDISGLAPLFDGEEKLAQGVSEFFQQNGYLVRIAIANTIGLAQGIAQYEKRSEHSTDILIAPDNVSPNQSHWLRSLPVAALRLEEWIVETLNQLGIRLIGQLLNLPRRDLSARFGNEIHRRIDQMTGKIAEPIVARQPVAEFWAEKLLDYPTSHCETIEVILKRLIEEICVRLSAVQQGALQWTIRLYCQSKLPIKLYVSLFQPTATAEDVVQLARMQLEQLFQFPTNHSNKPQASKHKKRSSKSRLKIKLDGQAIEVTEITVTVTSCVLLAHRQRKLFDENPRLDKQSLAHLINRLSNRLGRHNLVYPAIVSGVQPEHTFQLRPLVNPYSRGPRRTSTTNSTDSYVMARPLKMFQPAIALETVALSTADSSPQPPALLIFPDNRHAIVKHWGPERIETGWWRGPTTRRDYWRVETETHQQFWIYCELRKRQWFLHGAF